MLKNYTITVNGVAYDVTVEENGAGNAAPRMEMPVAPVKNVMPAAPTGPKGGKTVTAGAAGKLLKLEVKVGDTVKKGQSVAVLEVMKMETPIVSSDEGVVASVEVKEGSMVEAGQVLVTLN
ncbi:MAG: biotin/lipoyl-binding protein [Lachnospiraceae bacterium]|nr:biotin/lipoyl-binding protein [Lachnospiraceae bacterium]MBR4795148.1 biotin/lipoyl-binding protein [Lachnospiraceae bacterium]MBR5788882.1 biotin/lipoyl-binding protein [Lachnospiraceae bacterium]